MHSDADTATRFLPLVAHPSTPSDCVWRLEAHAQFTRPGVLRLHYSLHADIERLRIPSPESPDCGRRTDGLWKHTCFEAFFTAHHAPATAGVQTGATANRQSPAARLPPVSPSYLELNCSPSGNWALYRFSSYRTGMSPADLVQPPEIRLRRLDTRFELEATVHVSDLPELRGVTHLSLALAAVLEEESGRLSYWALRHAPGKPDFHHSEGFALELPS